MTLNEVLQAVRDYWFIVGPAVTGAAWAVRTVVRTHRSLRATWEGISAKVTRIDKALGPNGGTSIVDQVKRIEAEIAWMRGRSDADQRTAADPRLEMDARGMVTSANRAFEALVDRGGADMIGRGLIGVVHQEDRERVVSEWLHAVDDCRWFETILRLTSRDGTARVVKMSAEPMRASTGVVLGWLVVFVELDAQGKPV